VKKGFTLIELLVVLAVIAMLVAILLPGLSYVRLQSKVVAVNAELRQIGLALECYYFDHKKYPPTREDCQTGTLDDHLFQLPKELSWGGYLPAAGSTNVMATVMEDRFHRGHTYKYRSVGECVRDRDIIDKWIQTRLWIPDGFPGVSSLEQERGQWYSQPSESPVSWVVFSVGPRFDEQWLQDIAENRYPVPKETWYSPSEKRGFLVRIHAKNGNEYGSFERMK